jgi:hypothetical protein
MILLGFLVIFCLKNDILDELLLGKMFPDQKFEGYLS